MTSRRAFLKTASAAALAASAVHPLLTWASDASAISVAGKDGMIVRSYRFLDLETPVEFMTDWITPVNHFFVRNHMFEPAKIDASTWKLTIGGEVEKPLTLTLADLEKVPVHSVTNAMECAGNGRSLHNPKVPGIQWGKGAVGNAKFSGPSLKVVLEKAGVKDTGKHVMFRGLDEVPGKVPPFTRSIPIDKAMDPDTLIATHMNGASLARHHGFPARALVPGWIGAASCKWLTEIKVLDQEFEGNFMKPGYRLPNHSISPGGDVNPEDTHPITSLDVKSVIAQPGDGLSLTSHSLNIHGAAWAGETAITRVEISVDGGTTWHAARL